tara:strand:+ start:644 stop:1648 length:1005 start_codon:yes stop_codon:yes gene_type:complete
MKIYENHEINNSLKIESLCKYYIEILEIKDFDSINNFILEKELPVLVLGEGTNIIPPKYYEGIVLKPLFKNINFDKDKNIVSVGASVNWNSLVNEMIRNNIYGFENLSLIPGTVGAAPIQNIGAYGQEVSNLILKVDCYDYKDRKFISFNNDDCNFLYRNSSLKNKSLVIYNIDFITNHKNEFNIDYKSIQKHIINNDIEIKDINLKSISDIICSIRNSILPNPNEIPNAGSFFKNPIVKKNQIKTDHFKLDDLVIWNIDSEFIKVGAARLIQLIKKDLYDAKNIKIYEKHSLVLITNSKASQEEILKYVNQIQDKVLEIFNISLEVEPTIISN